MFQKFVLCSHKRIIGRDEYYGLVSCIRFGVGFSASLCCIKVIQIHVRPSNPSMLSIKKINISFYKTCFNTFLYQWWLNMCCITVKRITGVILCIIMKYKNLKVYDCIVSYVFKTMCWFSWEKLAFFNQCKPVLVHVPNSMLNEHFTWPVRDMNGVYIHCTCVLYSGPLMPFLHTPYWYMYLIFWKFFYIYNQILVWHLCVGIVGTHGFSTCYTAFNPDWKQCNG